MKVSKELEAKIVAQAAGKPAPKKLAAGWAVEFTLPCVVVSEMNRRGHWAVRRKRFEVQKTTLQAVYFDSPVELTIERCLPARVTFTHVGRRMDSDNLAGAFKALRDELADLVLYVDDGDERVEWVYEQTTGTPGVRVRIEGR